MCVILKNRRFSNFFQRTYIPVMHIESLDYPLIQIPAGTFTMGTIPTGMRKTDPEEPQRRVMLDAYAMRTVRRMNRCRLFIVSGFGLRWMDSFLVFVQ